ncbi:hypothetical protein GJW-30_1_03260 [Variibacter gotjawalensis]|uniref:Glycine transporter domain-containing protein n=1 Tax=Variibacter gotjawalensis TaxID=1333996 RepID=A0A0S3PXQ5_9BRAD|nr:trimeric intracellular cation channel family protein [Variibacter gotjawalensis]NIK46545.1 putative membrane protein YeiH [Variibacter gotjawalensis]RZS48450.1 putative membrane protein YeiH [Variibacter gotjawalensis]BAT60711.1 hypothetical protein GJW-30_1_03260 [Variibacter gotjawalensis]
MFGGLATVLDLFGVCVFAVTGALVASRKQMDVFGFALLATVTGIGGGTFRDLVLGRVPVFWVDDPAYLAICVATAVVVFFTAHIPESRFRVLLWFDAVGLSVACVIGANVGLSVGVSPFVAVVMGVITGTCGGIARDLLGGESPLILRKEIYVTAALIGAAIFVGLLRIGATTPVAAGAGFLSCLVIRSLALKYGWSLPTYRPRPGRTPQEVEDLQ